MNSEMAYLDPLCLFLPIRYLWQQPLLTAAKKTKSLIRVLMIVKSL